MKKIISFFITLSFILTAPLHELHADRYQAEIDISEEEIAIFQEVVQKQRTKIEALDSQLLQIRGGMASRKLATSLAGASIFAIGSGYGFTRIMRRGMTQPMSKFFKMRSMYNESNPHN